MPTDPTAYETIAAALLAALAHDDSEVRHSAAWGLRMLEPLVLDREDRDRVGEQLARALKDEDAEVRATAAEALGEYAAGFADLIDAVHDPEFEVRFAAARAIARHCAAMRAAGAVPAGEEEAVPPLVEGLRRMEYWAAEGLAALGGKAIPALLELLSDGEADVRSRALGALARIERPTEAGVAGVIHALGDPSPAVRHYAAVAAAALGATAAAVDAFLSLAVEKVQDLPAKVDWWRMELHFESEQWRSYAAPSQVRGTSELIELGEAAVPHLWQELRRGGEQPGDWRRRRIAAYAIAKILGPDASGAPERHSSVTRAASDDRRLPNRLIPALADPDPYVRRFVSHALWSIGRRCQDPLTGDEHGGSDWGGLTLANALDMSGTGGVVAFALGHVEPVSQPLLRQLLDHDEPVVRFRAAQGLAEIGVDDDCVIDALSEALAESDPDMRSGAAEALGTLGFRAAAAAPALAKLAVTCGHEYRGDGHPEHRAAADALARIGFPALGAIAEVLSTEGLGYCRFRLLADAVRAIGPTETEANRIIESLRQGGFDFRVLQMTRPHDGYFSALEFLKSLGDGIVPALARVLRDPDADLRQRTCEYLRDFGAEARVACAALTEALRDEDPEVRSDAARALGAIMPPDHRLPRRALSALKSDLHRGGPTDRQENSHWRHEAAEALAHLGATGADVFREALAAEDERARVAAAVGLAKAGLTKYGDSTEVIRLLERGVEHEEESTRGYAVEGLSRCGAHGLPALRRALCDDSNYVQSEAGRVIAESGPEGVALLIAALRDDQASSAAAWALMKDLGWRAASYLPQLVEGLSDEDVRVCRGAARALSTLPESCGGLIPYLKMEGC